MRKTSTKSVNFDPVRLDVQISELQRYRLAYPGSRKERSGSTGDKLLPITARYGRDRPTSG